ncbi:YkvA family protein [Halobacillus sp. H74]|uniref:YkvA family protein n=1 Tax=Halobacillus sp. H74 TaxID=3457436 RepID=UPI003FCD151B
MTKEKTYQEKLDNLNPKKAIARGRKYFSEKEFGKKLRKYSGQIGTKIVYYSLLLYYAFKSPETPKKAKLTIAGALGYLILPLDVIPDFIPAVGFADDSAVIIYAVYQVLSHIDEEVKGNAKTRMKKIFGDSVDLENLQDPLEEKDKK